MIVVSEVEQRQLDVLGSAGRNDILATALAPPPTWRGDAPSKRRGSGQSDSSGLC
jgi:hypothetical protein